MFRASSDCSSDPGNGGEGAPRGSRLKQWLFGTEQIVTTAALFPLDEYKGGIIADLFGDMSYFAGVDAFWTLQNACVASLNWQPRAGRQPCSTRERASQHGSRAGRR